MLRTVCGTDEFMAPELLMKSKAEYDFKVDVWSLGVVLFMMIFYKFPFQHT
jgi:serine/threonine protein kinase